MKTRNIFFVIAPIIISLIVYSCSQATSSQPVSSSEDKPQDARMDSLDAKQSAMIPLVSIYMESVEQHHAKLYFAGKNENWDLANYELDKLKTLFDKIKTNYPGSPPALAMPMILPSLDDMTSAIQSKNEKTFEDSYDMLTSNCNNCHVATNFGFNVIVVPTTPPVPDQDFKKQDE